MEDDPASQDRHNGRKKQKHNGREANQEDRAID